MSTDPQEPLDPVWQEFLNKCDDCCPVTDCQACGPCPVHDHEKEQR